MWIGLTAGHTPGVYRWYHSTRAITYTKWDRTTIHQLQKHVLVHQNKWVPKEVDEKADYALCQSIIGNIAV